MSLLDIHITGRALFFHSIGEQRRKMTSKFKAVPSSLLAEAVSMVKESSK